MDEDRRLQAYWLPTFPLYRDKRRPLHCWDRPSGGTSSRPNRTLASALPADTVLHPRNGRGSPTSGVLASNLLAWPRHTSTSTLPRPTVWRLQLQIQPDTSSRIACGHSAPPMNRARIADFWRAGFQSGVAKPGPATLPTEAALIAICGRTDFHPLPDDSLHSSQPRPLVYRYSDAI